MNAQSSLSAAVIRKANLRDASDMRRVEAFVRATPGATPFHLPQWLIAVEQGCGQPGHLFVAERGGAISGVLPLTAMHSPLVGSALVSSGFAVGGGILAATRSGTGRLADAAWTLAQRLSCTEVELRGGIVPKGWEAREGLYFDFCRPLADDPDAQLLSITRRRRAEIRKSFDSDLEIEAGTGKRDRDAHYRVYSEGVRNLGTPVFPRALFDAVLDSFGDEAEIMTVRHHGTPVASVLSLYFNGRVMPYWGGGTPAARALRASERLYFNLMNHARERGCTHFDFGRSKVNSGPYHFKKLWGFEPEPMVYARRLADNFEGREMNPDSPKYRLQVALWKRLPLPVANRIGPWIARGLG